MSDVPQEMSPELVANEAGVGQKVLPLFHELVGAPISEPSDARFSMRFVLIAMGCVSVVAAIAGAILQRCSEAVRVRLTVFWAIWLASMMALVAFQFVRRVRAERQAGATLLRLPKTGDP